MTVYATADQLAAFLGDDASVDEADRLLARASELLDQKILQYVDLDDTDTEAAMANACCAQVEFWLEIGEEHDIEGLADRQVSLGSMSLSALPPELAPRAARFLAPVGLLYRGVMA